MSEPIEPCQPPGYWKDEPRQDAGSADKWQRRVDEAEANPGDLRESLARAGVDADHFAKLLETYRQRAEKVEAENNEFRSTMLAAAEEIHEHWDAHCDADGYGPANLMRRLEQGIPAQYGYTAGEFRELQQRAEAAEAKLADAAAIIRKLAWLLGRSREDTDAPALAQNWLRVNGLDGTVLREPPARPAEGEKR